MAAQAALVIPCPGFHDKGLVSAKYKYYTCAICRKKASYYEAMWGCRTCNYDLCTKCKDDRVRKMKTAVPKLEKLFKKEYADKDDKEVMSEKGMLKFFKDCGVNPESYHTLIVAYHLNCADMGVYERSEFSSGFADSGCATKKDIKICIQNRIKSVINNQAAYKKFYRWIFRYVREDDKKKTISTDLAIQLWGLVFVKHKYQMPLLTKWLKWSNIVKDTTMKVLSRDVWEQTFDFLIETKTLNDYDDAGGSWPIAVDEFVEWLQDNNT